MEEIILKYEKFFKDNKFDIATGFILYNMYCNNIYDELTIEEKKRLANFAYEFYLKDESCIDIGKITDTILEHKTEILNGEIDRHNLYNYINY